LICIKLTAAAIACREGRRRCAAIADQPAFTDVRASMLVMQRAAKLFSRMSLLKAASHPNGIFARSLAIAGGEFEFECSIFAAMLTKRSPLLAELLTFPIAAGLCAVLANVAPCEANKIIVQAMAMLAIKEIARVPDEKRSVCMIVTY